ncbi:hypothetical protein Tco_0641717 [Tanacetum coccineum]
MMGRRWVDDMVEVKVEAAMVVWRCGDDDGDGVACQRGGSWWRQSRVGGDSRWLMAMLTRRWCGGRKWSESGRILVMAPEK